MKKFIITLCGAVAAATFILISPSVVADVNETEVKAPDVLEPLTTVAVTTSTSTTSITSSLITTTTTSFTQNTDKEEEVILEEDSVGSEDETSDIVYESESEPEPQNDDTSEYSISEDTDVSYAPQSTENRDISDYEYNLLINLTSSEYGAEWIPTDEKSKIAATVLNIADTYYDGSISDAIYNSCVPYGFDPNYNYYMDESIYDAVDNVINNELEWSDWDATSWFGDGNYNYFN